MRTQRSPLASRSSALLVAAVFVCAALSSCLEPFAREPTAPATPDAMADDERDVSRSLASAEPGATQDDGSPTGAPTGPIVSVGKLTT